jgi:signal transduction histidine kinase
MLSLFAFSYVFIAVFFSAFGLVIAFRGWQQKDNRLFMVWLFITAFWALACWRFHSIADHDQALFWARILAVSSLYIPLLLIHWTLHFLKLYKTKKYTRAVVWFSYMFVIFLTIIGFSPWHEYLVAGVAPKLFYPFWPERGILYTISIFYMYGGVGGYATYLLFLKYRQVRDNIEKKKQFFLVFMGTAVSFVSGATNFLLWFDIPVPPIGNALIPAIVCFHGYAIIKHHLFNVKAIAAEFITMLIWIFLFLRVIIAQTPQARVIDGFFFLLTVIFGTFLIKSVNNEVKQKEQLATLNSQLTDLNENLEAKVREQTKEIRRAYEVEKKARHELEELDKAKTDFILTTQHHLRTPLTIVRSALKSLLGRKEGDAYSKMDVAYIEKGDNATNTLVKLINDFLNISQMEVGKSLLNKEDLLLHEICEDVVSEMFDAIEAKRLSVKVRVAADARKIKISLDRKMIKDALVNLLDNAVKYTPEKGSISITGEIATHPIEKKKLYQLTIEDTGIGMTEEEQEKLFTRSFERGVRARELYATGKGIGLMVTKQVIRSHGGTIRAESGGRDKGSIFIIEFPIRNRKEG